MKICLIAHLKDLSGANLSLFDLALEYKNLGEKVSVVLPANGLLRQKLKSNNINTKVIISGTWVKYKDKRISIKDIIKITLNFFAELSYYVYFKKNQFDIIHFNSIIYGSGATAATKLGIPYVWHVREVPEKYMGLVFYRKNYSMEKVKKSYKVIVISKAVYNEMLKIVEKDKLVIIYNGIQMLESYNLRIFNEDFIDVMIVGAITKIKNQMQAVKIIDYTKKNGIKNIKLWIIGDIVEKEYYIKIKNFIDENDLQENVVFTGFKDDLSTYRQKIDFAMVCTIFEGFGKVTIEAMEYGQVVFGADIGGTGELINNGIDGILYPLDNDNIFKDKFLCTITNKSLCTKISRNAIEKSKKFSIEDTAQKILEQYKNCINRKL